MVEISHGKITSAIKVHKDKSQESMRVKKAWESNRPVVCDLCEMMKTINCFERHFLICTMGIIIELII